MKEEVERWLNKAEDDLKKDEDNFNLKNYDLTSFLCQQSIEKALKALLIEKTGKFPKIHDLIKLGKILNLDENLLKECELLNTVYIESRYPGISEDKYTKEESQKDIRTSKKILKWIKKKI